MNGKEFFITLQPENDQQGNRLLNRLLSLETAPDICWYPGSGTDLVPLLLDVPGNPTGRRLLKATPEHDQQPLLLWMNDYSESQANFPEDSLLGKEMSPSYPDLWQEHKATVTIGEGKDCYCFGDNGTLTLFTATVNNRNQGKHTRPEAGDEYLVCFSYGESEQLLRTVFSRYLFHLHAVMLIRQGGFSCQRRDFQQYEDLPNLVAKLSKNVGKVDSWVIDGYGQENGKPMVKSLEGYKSFGEEIDWGWAPTHLFH